MTKRVLGVIGGSGIYEFPGLSQIEEKLMELWSVMESCRIFGWFPKANIAQSVRFL